MRNLRIGLAVATVWVAAAGAASAASLQCMTPNYTVDVTVTPYTSTGTTLFEYQLTDLNNKNPDHAVTVFDADEVVVDKSASSELTLPGEGDSILGAGEFLLSKQTLRVNPQGAVANWFIEVEGIRACTVGDVVVKAGSKRNSSVEECIVCVPGEQALEPGRAVETKEVNTLEGCQFETLADPITGGLAAGSVLNAGTPECPFGAVLNGGIPIDIANYEISCAADATQCAQGQQLGTLLNELGEETKFTHGDGTCLTDIRFGTLITFCTCQPGSTDPSPPCP